MKQKGLRGGLLLLLFTQLLFLAAYLVLLPVQSLHPVLEYSLHQQEAADSSLSFRARLTQHDCHSCLASHPGFSLFVRLKTALTHRLTGDTRLGARASHPRFLQILPRHHKRAPPSSSPLDV